MAKKPDEKDAKIAELTADLQRIRADFENYRKRVDEEKQAAREYGEATIAAKLLPVIDDIERAVTHLPTELADNVWAQGVASLEKNLSKSLEAMGITKILAEPGSNFDPDQHHAVQFDGATGESAVISEELQPGYLYKGTILRPAMVRVSGK